MWLKITLKGMLIIHEEKWMMACWEDGEERRGLVWFKKSLYWASSSRKHKLLVHLLQDNNNNYKINTNNTRRVSDLYIQIPVFPHRAQNLPNSPYTFKNQQGVHHFIVGIFHPAAGPSAVLSELKLALSCLLFELGFCGSARWPTLQN